MLRNSFVVVLGLILLSACATVKQVDKAPVNRCYVAAGTYIMKFSLLTSNGCGQAALPAHFVNRPFLIEANLMPCGRKIMVVKGGQGVLDFGPDGIRGQFGVSDGKCTVIYEITSMRVK